MDYQEVINKLNTVLSNHREVNCIYMSQETFDWIRQHDKRSQEEQDFQEDDYLKGHITGYPIIIKSEVPFKTIFGGIEK